MPYEEYVIHCGYNPTYTTRIQKSKGNGETLHQVSLNLTTSLIEHYKKVIKNEQDELEKIKIEIANYLKHLSGTTRDARWKQQSKTAEEEARKLSESLRESCDSKLFRKRKRTESMSNLVPNASKQALLPNAPKQPILQLHPTDLLQALTGLVNTFSKTDENTNNHSNINHNTDHNRLEEKAPQMGKVSQGRAFLQTDSKEMNNV